MGLLEDLSKAKGSLTRLAVAENQNCPGELRLQLLEELQKDKSQEIRLDVAQTASCPESVRMALSEDKDILFLTQPPVCAPCSAQTQQPWFLIELPPGQPLRPW